MWEEEKEEKKGKLGGFEWATEFDWDRRAVTAVTMAIRHYGNNTRCSAVASDSRETRGWGMWSSGKLSLRSAARLI